MAIPTFQDFMLPLLRRAAEGEIRSRDAVSRLSDELALTEEELAERIPSGTRTKVYDRVTWAKTYLTRAGLLQSTRRGHFDITERGAETLKQQPDRIDVKFLRSFEEFRQWQDGSVDSDQESGVEVPAVASDDRTPEDELHDAHRSIEQELRSGLLDRLQDAPPSFFEHVVVRLLESMYGHPGDGAGVTVGKPGDGGVDGEIYRDPLGLDRVYIQAKRYASDVAVGPGDIHKFIGSLHGRGASQGVFVTTSRFTSGAISVAQGNKVVLVDGEQLADLMVQCEVGVRTEATLHVKRIDEDFFE